MCKQFATFLIAALACGILLKAGWLVGTDGRILKISF